MLRIVFLLIFILTGRCQSEPQFQAVLSCLKVYRPSFVVLFACWKRQGFKYARGEKRTNQANKLSCSPRVNVDKVMMHKMISSDKDVEFVRLVFARPESDSLAKTNTKKYEKFTYYLDLECGKTEEILKEASIQDKFGKFQFLYSWYLLLDKTRKLTDIWSIFQKLKTRMDMEVKVFQAYQKNSFEIYEIFNPGINVGVQMRYIGKLINGDIIMDDKRSYYEARKNMSGVLVRSANVIRYPFKTSFHDYMVDTKLMKYDIYSKFHYQLFLGLVEIHRFDYNTTLAFSWFGNTSSGEDGGLAKMLWDDTIDISSAGCIMRLLGTERIDFYDFIMPYYKFRSCFYFRNPGFVKPNFNEVMKPFAKESWLVTLYVTGIVCVCIEITYFVQSRNNTENNRWYRSVFVVIAAFSQQGLDTIPNQMPSRIIFLYLLICSLLLYNYYTSSLVSSLISTEPEVFKTLKELLESKLKVGIEFQPYTITYMQNRVKEDHYLDLLNKTKIYENDSPNIFTAEEGIKKVHQGDFAFHAESITAYPIIGDTFAQDAICDLAEIVLINSDTSLMAQKKSQYKKLFQISLRKMWQSGVIRKLHKTWVTAKPECLSSARVISVTINDMFMPYFLLAMGVLLALLILLAETVWKKFRFRIRRIFQNDDFHIIYVN